MSKVSYTNTVRPRLIRLGEKRVKELVSRRNFIQTCAVGALSTFFMDSRGVARNIEQYPTQGHPGHRIKVRDKDLYVDATGPVNAPAVLYIHGGPGAGSYDFGLFQRDPLSNFCRLIQFDQRGALRSQTVEANEPFTLRDIVEDIEAIRKQLNIQHWSIITHSFGGLTTMLYALSYPESIDKIIFENPTFDIGASDRSMTRMLIDEFRRQKMDSEGDEFSTALASASSPREAWKLFGRAGRKLGTKRRLDLYAPFLPSGYFFDWMSHSGLSEEIWLRGSGPSQETLWKDAQVFEDFRPRLKELQAPAVLFKGRMDANTGPDQIESFQSSVKDGRLVTFAKSGHLIHAEEPKLFAQTVRAVLLA